MDHRSFVAVDLFIQLLQEASFLIRSTDLPDVFQGFLNAVRHLNSRCFCDL